MDIANHLSTLYREHSGKVMATLVRLIGDWDLAEEAMHESFAVATKCWKRDGAPSNPTAWLISTARFKAIDIIRRNKRFAELQPDLERWIYELDEHNQQRTQQDIEDDQLRLIFICCHPAIDPKIQIPLTLREVCGLTTEEIANAFLLSPATLAQRIVRGKRKIRDANIPFALPHRDQLQERLDAVLAVIYLAFNEGYSASSGDHVTRHELSGEAIRLARLVLSLLPEAEVAGLLALMLLHEARRESRTDADGDIVLLEDQDRSLWKRDLIQEGSILVRRAMASGRFGSYTLQAAIAAIHAQAPSAQDTDWTQITALYSVLLQVEPSPVIELNRAVAVAMKDGPEAGLELIDAIADRHELENYHLFHATRGELLRREGLHDEALLAYTRAESLAKQGPELRLIQKRIDQLRANS